MCWFTNARTVVMVFARSVGSEAMYCAGVLTFDGGFMDSSSSRTSEGSAIVYLNAGSMIKAKLTTSIFSFSRLAMAGIKRFSLGGGYGISGGRLSHDRF